VRETPVDLSGGVGVMLMPRADGRHHATGVDGKP
jgi:hypothetical protein